MRIRCAPQSVHKRSGAVFTQPHFVEMILDLASYCHTRDLSRVRLLEPACGDGAFVGEAVTRLVASAKLHGRPLHELSRAVRAYDVDPARVAHARRTALVAALRGGAKPSLARELSQTWVRQADFLLSLQPAHFDVVVGNPPYVKNEHIPEELRAKYRARFEAMYGRGDLYIAFIERGLSLLRERGVLVYICSDRWTVANFGRRLRGLVTERYALKYYVHLHDANAFATRVGAYTSIVAIDNDRQSSVRLAKLVTSSPNETKSVSHALVNRLRHAQIKTVDHWFTGDAPWSVRSTGQLRVLRDLEKRCLPIERTASVNYSAGTGLDAAFVVTDDVDIERERLLPFVTREDIDLGATCYSGRFLVNVYASDGELVDIEQFPKMHAHLQRYERKLRNRSRVWRHGFVWYQTNDRIRAEIANLPKLLFPDIVKQATCVFDQHHFPHASISYITSDVWNLEVLGALLSSQVAWFFLRSYAPEIAGGYVRGQAQFLRRIRLPDPASISLELSSNLRQAFRAKDRQAMDRLALQAYGLDQLPVT